MSVLRRINAPNAAYFVTVCLPRRAELRLTDDLLAILAQAVDSARVRCDFHLLGYVFMPDHWHGLFAPLGETTISDVLTPIKSSSGFHINRALSRRGPFWEARFYDHILRKSDDYRKVLNYMHHNPCAAGIAEHPGQWRWSSWQDYYAEGGPVGVDCAMLPRADDRPEQLPAAWRRGEGQWRLNRVGND